MKRIAIVEDEKKEAEKLKSFLKKFEGETGERFDVLWYSDAIAFLTGYRSNFDIVLMDIELPDINGMEAAVKLRAIDPVVTLIFVTNMAQFAVKGYEVQAFRFIVKPVSYDNFSLCLKRAIYKIQSEKNFDRTIAIPLPTGVKRVSASALKYVEVVSHHLSWHTEEGVIESSGSLSKVEKDLEGANFFRCNSCYLVNLKYVTEISGYDVFVGRERLTVSHPRRRDFMLALNEYLGR
ncbi:MAG: response regulator transcription factor [Clostridia bacterium]|nr:response regulator transcription factor [Clostridia bacterium]